MAKPRVRLYFAQGGFPHDYRSVCPSLQRIDIDPPQYKAAFYDFFATPKLENEAWFWSTFARPVDNAQRFPQYRPTPMPNRKLSPLERLPVELIELIVTALRTAYTESSDGMESVISMGLSSSQLWPVVLDHIHREYARNELPSKAGARVVYRGRLWHDPSAPLHKTDFDTPQYLWRHAISQNELDWARSVSDVGARCNAGHERPLSLEDRKTIMNDVLKMYLYPQDRVWLLRNLTTRQFVRSDELRPPQSIIPTKDLQLWRKDWRKSNHSKGQRFHDAVKEALVKLKLIRVSEVHYSKPSDFEPLTLAQIFLVMVCQDDKDISLWWFGNGASAKHGPWNLHTFDVVTMEHHLHDTGYTKDVPQFRVEVWTDVTGLVVADVGNVRWCVKQPNVHSDMWWYGGTPDYGLRNVIHKSRLEHRGRMQHDVDEKARGITEEMDDAGMI